MLEHSKAKLASKDKFKSRLVRFTLVSAGIFMVSLSIGIFGYHYIAKLDWMDAFLNASMILGGMGPVADLIDPWAKFFAGCYSLFSGVAFISGMAVFLTPILHRFLHRFHLDVDDESKPKGKK